MSAHPCTTAIVLFAHGSRDPLWHAPINAVRQRMLEMQPQVAVCCAYLELTSPSMEEAVAALAGSGVQRMHIVPMFLGVGRHAREDLPALVAAARARHPEVAFSVDRAVGEQSAVIELLADIALAGACTVPTSDPS